MAEPSGKQSISGVLACWFDEPADCSPAASVATLNPPASIVAAPAVQFAPQTASDGPSPAAQATSRFFDLMEAINDKHVLPDVFVPRSDKAEKPLAFPVAQPQQPAPVKSQPVKKISAQQIVSEICQSHDSPLYQWLMRNQLAAEFDLHTHSVEQRWSPDGTYCSVRRTANGYTHTIVLKDNNTRTSQRITGPDGNVLLHISASGALIENNRQPALMTA